MDNPQKPLGPMVATRALSKPDKTNHPPEEELAVEQSLDPVKQTRGTPLGKHFEIPPNYKRLDGSKLSLLDFEIGQPLGCGRFGHVYVVRERKTKYIFALKRMSKQYIVRARAEKNLRREVEIQSRLHHHPHILKLYTWFHDEDSVYLVLEFCVKGDVHSELKRERTFTQRKAANYFVQVCSALIHCRQKKVIHRDVKPKNLLLDVMGEVKLSDFGLSVRSQKSRRKTFCGTRDYMAPEIIERMKCSYEIDTWSAGVLLYEFLFGKPPFFAQTRQWTYHRIKNVKLRFPKDIIVDPEAKDLITKILRKNADERLDLTSIYDHAWIQKYVDPAVVKRLKKENGLI